MKVSKAGKIWLDYHHIHSKKNTLRVHSFVDDAQSGIVGQHQSIVS